MMNVSHEARTRALTVVAQDPTILGDCRILTARVDIPTENIGPGPCGHRAQVIEYDASVDTFYKPLDAGKYRHFDEDPFAELTDGTIMNDPCFHCQNVHALVTLTPWSFERALGHRVSWSSYGHQLEMVSHSLAGANAFYSERDDALFFGYFPPRENKGMVYTCLSHDVVVHETAHTLVDGLRDLYTEPSSKDQAAFHEGFADMIALLSVFSIEDVVTVTVRRAVGPGDPSIVRTESLTRSMLK